MCRLVRKARLWLQALDVARSSGEESRVSGGPIWIFLTDTLGRLKMLSDAENFMRGILGRVLVSSHSIVEIKRIDNCNV